MRPSCRARATRDAFVGAERPAQVCGSGYTQLHRLTLKTSYVGKKTMTGVVIDVIDGREAHDKNNYEYYADTKVYAPHQCVTHNGFIYSEGNYGGTWAGAAYGHFDWCDRPTTQGRPPLHRRAAPAQPQPSPGPGPGPGPGHLARRLRP
ncbi:hypothetical protein OHA72_52830 [Dactylosporangium sp. NBC_01737]|uniref:hypothetical protein n=1 Tax=Dactylosporangium sp. NBC_01737 TaxID=2975959 RepID=UPI002E152745|nr:hypothetical protein OHA72_52830 [Dactylosporangium sp. NBC_01737]